MTEINSTQKLQPVRWGCLWTLVLLVHMAALVGWWWFTPKGFPIEHSRFWVNSLLPWVGFVLLAVGIVNFARLSPWRDVIFMMIPGFWVGSGIAIIILFPRSSSNLMWLFVPTVICFSILAWSSLNRTSREVLALLTSACLGGFVAFSQQAPPASTRPIQTKFKPPSGSLSGSEIHQKGPVLFDPEKAIVSITVADTKVVLRPLLTFHSRSADRCWTNLADSHDRNSPVRRTLGVRRKKEAEWIAFYQSDYDSQLSVNVRNPKRIALDSTAHLPRPIYSHLNHYCDLSIITPRPISVLFSPCPDTPIDVTASALKASHAYFTEDGFHLVETANADKGPFTEIASGELARGDPLILTFIVGNVPLFHFELKDWSREASLELSPTAGWGLPMNAISLWPSDRGCLVRATLAGTSLGIGYDSVGHREGTYRGRMLVEILD